MFARNQMHLENTRLLTNLDAKVDHLVSQTATAAVLVTKLAEAVDKHEHSIYGNGNMGLRDRLNKMEQSYQFVVRLMWMGAPIVLGLVLNALWPHLLMLR